MIKVLRTSFTLKEGSRTVRPGTYEENDFSPEEILFLTEEIKSSILIVEPQPQSQPQPQPQLQIQPKPSKTRSRTIK